MLKTIITICSEDDEREEAISSGGLDLIVVPGLGFTKVSLCLLSRRNFLKLCRTCSNMRKRVPGSSDNFPLQFGTPRAAQALPMNHTSNMLWHRIIVLLVGFIERAWAACLYT